MNYTILMKNLARVLLLMSITSLSSIAIATPITIVSQADNWDYNFGASFGAGGANSVTFADFTAGYTGTNNGLAAFGNNNITGAPVQTFWAAGTSLFAQTTVNLSGTLTGDATLNLAVDNGAAVWINGNLAFQADEGGFTSIWEYSTTADDAFFIDGINTISVIANDYGSLTYFDMELLGDIVPNSVPEPSTLALLGMGLAGFVFSRRKKG